MDFSSFVVKVIVYLICILFGYHIFAHRKLAVRIIVAVIYGITFLYYTFLSRIELVKTAGNSVGGAAAADDGHVSLLKILEQLFVMQVYDRSTTAFMLNIMLFVPMGYIAGRAVTVKLADAFHRIIGIIILGFIISFAVEILQEITGYGMFDWLDITANVMGMTIGGMMLVALPLISSKHRYNGYCGKAR